MTTCSTDVVCQLENLIAKQVGPQRYNVWFKNATRFSFADGFVRIGVPNQFIGGWLENHYSGTIQKAAREVTGKDLEVAFGIDTELARSLRKKQPDLQVDYVADNSDRMARHCKQQGVPPVVPKLRGRFDGFVVGDSNRLAHTTALAVARHPATQFNPLFIHGACGLGKTHLLQAIHNCIHEDKPELTCVCVTGEDFTNQFVYAVKSNERDAFRHRYRLVDVLIIDDIHFLAHKRATQEEFLHTFNTISEHGKQVVMASDAHPKLIGHLSESLVNRFVSGMVVKIDSPGKSLRVGILKQRVERMNRAIPEAVIECIAERFSSNVRELEGALLQLIAMAEVTGEPLTPALADKAIDNLVQHTLPVLHLSHIEAIVSIYFGLAPADLHTSRKPRTIALARGIVMYLARKHTSMSYPEIGRHMGNKNHSTVILANRRIAKYLKENSQVCWTTPCGEKQASIRQLMQELEEQLSQANGSV
ncbi:MAG: chromosomal replication initiator protein DnaA [Phycisphaerae bacterium]|nr:chromosomal replication initiator protein DnaA [Phycisphaerae bacterium]